MSAPLPASLNGNSTSIQIGYGGFGEYPFEFILPEGKKSDTGYLKLFLSTKYVALHDWVAQSSPFEMEVNNNDRTEQKTPRSETDVWDALVASITVVREEPAKSRPSAYQWLRRVFK